MLNNYTNFSNASNFDIRKKQKNLNSSVGITKIGTALTDSTNQKSSLNKNFASNTNTSVKVSVKTRTRDQNFINQYQLAFIYTKNYDNPILLSLSRLNLILAGGDILNDDNNKKIFGSKNPESWTKSEIQKKFKLFGVIVNKDNDTSNNIPLDRASREFTICVRGDCHLYDYWSHDSNRLKRYDSCYLILKKVFINNKCKYQTNSTSRIHDSGEIPLNIGKGKYVWQILPYNTNKNSVDPEIYTTKIYPDKINQSGGEDNSSYDVIGSYFRVGYVHEYASIDKQNLFSNRDDYSVSRDITYLTNNNITKPVQFYLNLDNESKLV